MGAMSGIGDGQQSTFVNPFLSAGPKGPGHGLPSENSSGGRGSRRPSSGGNVRHDPQVEKRDKERTLTYTK